MFENFAEAQIWYDGGVTGGAAMQPGYAIVTTNQIVAASNLLDDFVAHKQAMGYTVQIVTEDDYEPLTAQAQRTSREDPAVAQELSRSIHICAADW
ncbi:MAG: hypothetical protein R2838_07615 [Caldilineaceae bacterium]